MTAAQLAAVYAKMPKSAHYDSDDEPSVCWNTEAAVAQPNPSLQTSNVPHTPRTPARPADPPVAHITFKGELTDSCLELDDQFAGDIVALLNSNI